MQWIKKIGPPGLKLPVVFGHDGLWLVGVKDGKAAQVFPFPDHGGVWTKVTFSYQVAPDAHVNIGESVLWELPEL